MLVSLSRRLLTSCVALILGAVALTSCSSDDADTRPTVAVAFYPLEFVVSELAGDIVAIDPLTKPGGEPHDLELSAAKIGEMQDADLVVYLSGFQPAVDDAVADLDPAKVLDVAQFADLQPFDSDNPEREESQTDLDPHFWLDPLRLRDVAVGVQPELAAIDAALADSTPEALTRLSAKLEGLDRSMTTGLATCENRAIVTTHSAFAYLAARYDLEQQGIAGLSPETEPSAQDLADATTFVKDNKVSTIYFETLIDPAIAKTIASETGAATAVLDPVEGLTDASEGTNYLEVMQANLANLIAGQRCG